MNSRNRRTIENFQIILDNLLYTLTIFQPNSYQLFIFKNNITFLLLFYFELFYFEMSLSAYNIMPSHNRILYNYSYANVCFKNKQHALLFQITTICSRQGNRREPSNACWIHFKTNFYKRMERAVCLAIMRLKQQTNKSDVTMTPRYLC